MRVLVIIGLLVGVSTLVGCGAGVARTYGERQNTYRQAFDMDMRQINDDWDLLWLADHPYRLTRYHVR